jgi:large subunit ribosomal protein L6
MSRLGKLPIKLGQGVTAAIKDGFITVRGPKGELKQKLHDLVNVEVNADEINVKVNDPQVKKERAFWGLYRSLLANMVKGVTDGFSKKLEINGVGYRASIAGQKLTMTLGFSHPVIFELPQGITGLVEANTITLTGADKQQVGEVAAQIRKIRKPEPYKGKGIKYADEVLIRKEGKSAGKGE